MVSSFFAVDLAPVIVFTVPVAGRSGTFFVGSYYLIFLSLGLEGLPLVTGSVAFLASLTGPVLGGTGYFPVGGLVCPFFNYSVSDSILSRRALNSRLSASSCSILARRGSTAALMRA